MILSVKAAGRAALNPLTQMHSIWEWVPTHVHANLLIYTPKKKQTTETMATSTLKG